MTTAPSLSFMGANLVAQQLDFAMTDGWSQGETAANDHYQPIETFEQRFAAFVDLTAGAGFDTIDVWTGQLNWVWATPAHYGAARRVLAGRGVRVASYAGGFGDTVDELRQAIDTAAPLGTIVLGGNAGVLATNRAGTLDLLRQRGVVLAIENHPERHPDEVLAKIGDDDDVLAATVDTGWWGTQGVDAAEAIRRLGSAVRHVHMKDVRAAGAHETCALGDGVVPIEVCLRALAEIGYDGPISIEHVPETYDPMPEIIESRRRVLAWLGVDLGP